MSPTASELHKQFRCGDRSAEEITKDALGKIDTYNPKINAFLNVFHKRALDRAKALDANKATGKPQGKLAGIPIALKDNIQVKGEVTTCASKFLEDYRSLYDATVVRLLEEEDAILIGKTNLDEFAMGASGTHSAFGPTKNPWNEERVTGGSSSGSAATVSARICPIALGSDTGGSVRQPASFTGVVGFKPTYGRVSRFGLVAFGSSLDQIGPITTNVEDAALVMEVLGRHCNRDSTSLNAPIHPYTSGLRDDMSGIKIGVPGKFIEDLAPSLRKNYDESLDVCKSLGAQLVDVDLSILKHSVAVYYILATAEASTNLARFDGIRYGKRSKEAKTLNEVYYKSRQEGFGWEVKNRILLGTFVLSGDSQEAYYEKAQKVRTLINEAFHKAFEQCDLIAMPTAPSTAFSFDHISDPLEEYLQDLYTIGANLAGLPAISLPSGFDDKGMPIGFQILGPQMSDEKVLAHAHAFTKATGFFAKVPKKFGDSS